MSRVGFSKSRTTVVTVVKAGGGEILGLRAGFFGKMK